MMITEPQACLRYISSIHRRTVHDVPQIYGHASEQIDLLQA